ncbi:MAG TPA: orotate phosphoribosyltransferase [Kiritimatiellia bacterium]|nr:orotate phosphoribosyltransferase [Kiritimatiellia bacterium]
MTRNDLLTELAARSTLHGEFLLRSGAVSSIYFDKYRFEGDPRLLNEVARLMVPLVPEGVDALAGLEMGGIPVATLLSQHTGLPTRFVRKEAKGYGTCNLAEGGEIEGKKLLVVEDVVTSGGQILLSVADLRARGAVVENVVCVIDRESGGRENLGKEGLCLSALFTMTELKGV